MESDVLVIGAGMGGCVAAITAKECGLVNKVVLVEKSHAGTTGPSAFVGGSYRGYLPEDDPDEIVKNGVEHYDYLVDQETFEKLVRSGPETVKSLERWGVKFVKEPDGKYARTFHRGTKNMWLDGGGIPMMKALADHASKVGVEIVDRVTITDLLTHHGSVIGAVGINCRTGEFFIFKSKATILATGGTLFKTRQPGHRQLSGDGWAMEYRAGAEIAGMDCSVSNIYGATLEVGPGNGLYLGQGARLLNNKMEEYVKNYPELEKIRWPEWHPPLMAMEARRGNAPPVWLDMRHFTTEQVDMIYKSVPYAAKRWEKLGFLKEKKFVRLCEYAPEGPRPRGGVLLNSGSFESRNIRGLFACGEAVTVFQIHAGLNLAASSGIIAGKSAAETASRTEKPEVDSKQVEELKQVAMSPIERTEGVDPEYVLTLLQEVLHPYYVHILRSEKYLKKAIGEIETIRDTLVPSLYAHDPHCLRLANDIRSMTLCAEMFLRSAVERKESRYCALREDYPYMDNTNWLKLIIVKKDPETGRMKVNAEDIPIERCKLKPERKKILHPFWARAEELGWWERLEKE